MEHPSCHRIYVTHILKDFECDVFMPAIDPAKFSLVGYSIKNFELHSLTS
jgi:dihydrofolate reductase